jgi:transglutaminase-like putative cysteine protease
LPEATAVTLCAGALLRVGSSDRRPRGAAGPGQRRLLSRGAVTGCVWTTAVATAAVTITWTLPWPAQNTGYDLRDRVTAPVRTSTAVDPLAQLARWRQASGTPLFTVTGPASERWRLCALTAFDGQRWAPEGTFMPTGGVMPAAGPAGRRDRGDADAAASRPVRHRVVLSGLHGAFLPVPTEPVRIVGPAVAVSPRDGTVLATRGTDRGTAYTVDSVPVARPAPVALTGLRSANAGSAARALPPGVPGALAELARTSTGRADTPYARAAGIAKRLRDEYTYVPKAPGVATYGGVARFLDERQGPSVVFAAAFVLSARLSGLPARLVVGFVPGPREGAVSGGRTVDIAGRDARVWGEVYFEGAGWLPFDPVPRPGRARSVDVPPTATAHRPTSSPTPSATASRPADRPKAAPATPRATPRTVLPDPSDWLLPLCLSLAALLFAARALRLVVLPALRERRSRRAAAPADRVRGAWQTAVGRLVDAGVPVPLSASVTDVGRLLADAAGQGSGPAAAGLARAAGRALYGDPGPPDPGMASCVTAEEADRAWDRCDRLLRALRRRSGIIGSSWWLLLVPRPLLLDRRRARAASRGNRGAPPNAPGVPRSPALADAGRVVEGGASMAGPREQDTSRPVDPT